MDKSVLPTGYRFMGDGIVYDKVWDETSEELVFYSSSGHNSEIFEECAKSNMRLPNFLTLITNLSYEHPTTTAF